MTAPEHLSKSLAQQYRTQGEFLHKFNKPLGAKYMGLHDDLIRAKKELGHGLCFCNDCLGYGGEGDD